jgi:hypothetical protein
MARLIDFVQFNHTTNELPRSGHQILSFSRSPDGEIETTPSQVLLASHQPLSPRHDSRMFCLVLYHEEFSIDHTTNERPYSGPSARAVVH